MGTRNLIQYSTIPNPIPVPVESTPEKNKRLEEIQFEYPND
jgi:hypothetical protein